MRFALLLRGPGYLGDLTLNQPAGRAQNLHSPAPFGDARDLSQVPLARISTAAAAVAVATIEKSPSVVPASPN